MTTSFKYSSLALLGLICSCNRSSDQGVTNTSTKIEGARFPVSDLGLLDIDTFELASASNGRVELHLDIDGVRSKLIEYKVDDKKFRVYVQRGLPTNKLRVSIISDTKGKTFALLDDVFSELATEVDSSPQNIKGEYLLIKGEKFEDGSKQTKLILKTY